MIGVLATLGFLLASLRNCHAATVRRSDVYPTIEYWNAGDFSPNPLCTNPQPSFVPAHYGSRAGAGLYGFAQSLYEIYRNSVQSWSLYDVQYGMKQQNLNTTYDGLKQCASMSPARAIQQNVVLKNSPVLPAMLGAPTGSVAQGMCECLAKTTAPTFCYTMGNWSAETQCMTSYEYQDYNEVLSTELDAKNDYGWQLPETCLNSESAGVYPVDLPLTNYVIDEGVPAQVEYSGAAGEGPTYYMLYKAIDHLNRYAEHKYLEARYNKSSSASSSSLFSDDEIFTEILPSWDVYRVFYMNQVNFNNVTSAKLPYMVMAGNNQTGDLLFTIRDTLTTFEERLALYNQLSLKYLYNFTGTVHDGATTLFQATIGTVDFSVDNWYRNYDTSALTAPRIVVTSSGLPANGLAVMLADHLKKKVSAIVSPNILDVSCVTFGAPMVGDATFVAEVAANVNLRNINLQGDSSNVFPCAKTFSCAEDTLFPRTGLTTGEVMTYAPLPGQVDVLLSSMAGTNTYWGTPDAAFDLAAIKYCGYKCWVTSQFCKDDPEINQCDPQTCELMFTPQYW